MAVLFGQGQGRQGVNKLHLRWRGIDPVRHGAERALCSLDRVDVGDTATLRSGNTPPWWMFPPSARSHLLLRVRKVGADGHLMHKKCASPTKMQFV